MRPARRTVVICIKLKMIFFKRATLSKIARGFPAVFASMRLQLPQFFLPSHRLPSGKQAISFWLPEEAIGAIALPRDPAHQPMPLINPLDRMPLLLGP